MKKCFTLSALFVLAISCHLYAGTVSISDAQHVAQNFFQVTKPGTVPVAMLKYTQATGTAVDFYVFDISGDQGFVMVAADDLVKPILAYSTEGGFRTDFAQVGLNKWIHNTSRNIRLALQSNVAVNARITNQWTAYRQGYNPASQRSGVVTPLCATRWDQENEGSNGTPYLYNIFCPHNSGHNQRTLTGCVATSMAQVMKYWNYPAQGVDSFSYTDSRANGYSANYGVQSSNFSAHTYQWSQMPVALDGLQPAEQDTAVSLLMYDCAVSVSMDFGDDNQDGSGAEALIADKLAYGGNDSSSSEYAFVKYFSYDPDSIRGILQADYTDSLWTEVLKRELDKGRPFMYGGFDQSQGGHEWVCDGYDANDMLHMNWGWSGYDNGYYAVTDLTTSGGFNPTVDADALIGIVPKRAHTTSVKEPYAGFTFNIFPNPASGTVTIQATQAGGLSVRNAVGQTVISQDIDAKQMRLDVSGLSAGIYVVELRQGDKTVVKKLAINK